MASLLVHSLLLCAVFGAVLCDTPEIQVVKNIIAKSHNFLRDNNQTEILLPDIGRPSGPIKFWEGRLGQFDTLELLSEPQVLSRTSPYGTIFTFNVSTALSELNINYNFHVNYPLFGRYRNLSISAEKNSFQLEGRVVVKDDGSCSATLQDAKATQFQNFKVDFDSKDLPLVNHIKIYILHIVQERMVQAINFVIGSEVRKPDFSKGFNKYVCDEVTRN